MDKKNLEKNRSGRLILYTSVHTNLQPGPVDLFRFQEMLGQSPELGYKPMMDEDIVLEVF